MEVINNLKRELKKAIIGHDDLINAMLIGLISNGHILIEGVPGIAKTTAIKTLADAINLDFKRVQFTPDLLPSDIIGIEIYNPKTNEFQIKKGPIFTNFLLADEINRAPAKVQSALLEAMAEKQVTIGEENFILENPFLVFATQNPIEQEGTYPLPEAQLDRFMLKVDIGYNSLEEEIKILKLKEKEIKINQVATKEDILKLQNKVKNIHIDEELIKYIATIIDATRNPNKYNLKLAKFIELGVSPRGTISLLNSSKANALIKNKDYVAPSDIIEMVYFALNHRIKLNYLAEAEDIKPKMVLKEIIETIDIP